MDPGSGTPAAPISLFMGATSVVNLWVVCYQMRAGHRLQSKTLLADATHRRADVIITMALIGGMLRRATRPTHGVRSVSGSRARRAAGQRFAEVTMAVDGRESVATALQIADQVEGQEFGLDPIVVRLGPC